MRDLFERLDAAPSEGGATDVADPRGDPGRAATDARLEGLRGDGTADAVVDTRFRRLSRLAASLLEAPTAFVSLVDEQGRFFSGARALTSSVRQRRALPISETLCQHVALAGEMLVIPDTSNHPVTRAHPALASDDVGAYLGVPILDPSSGEVLGTLCVMDRRTRAWTPAQITILEEIAAAAASEIRVRAVASRIEELHREQRFLAEVGAAAAASLDLIRLAETVARLAVEHFADCAAVSLSAGGVATTVAEPGDRSATVTRLYEAVAAGPLDGGACVLLSQDAGQPIIAAAVHELGAHSALLVPIVHGGRGAGALLLIASDPARSYSEADVHLAEEVARLVGLAVENARLFSETRAAVQAREDMLSVVSHDLRNPLGVISTATQLLQANSKRLSGEETEKYLAMIRRAADSAVVLVADLLEMARLEAGKYELARRPLDVSAVIAEVRETQQPLADRVGVTLTCRAPKAAFTAWADRERLLRVFGNLIGNALKFTPAGGSVTVGGETEQGGVRFFVEDTGSGIADENLDRLFTRFWQAEAADERGAGLGLSIVKAIVEAHEGRVWAESRLGEGTTIHFWLPSPHGEATAERG